MSQGCRLRGELAGERLANTVAAEKIDERIALGCAEEQAEGAERGGDVDNSERFRELASFRRRRD